jgi:hypothetical protein
MCVLPVSENPHGNTMNDALIFDFPHLATPNRVKKRVSGRFSSSPLGHQISSNFGSDTEMRR